MSHDPLRCWLAVCNGCRASIAGAGVGQSIWKQEQAYQRALQSKPADATVTGSHCHANYMGMDTVWTCTVMWDDRSLASN